MNKYIGHNSQVFGVEEHRLAGGKGDGTDMFIIMVRKYTRVKKLTERMMNELIEKIEMHKSERINGVNVQKLTIHWNCPQAQ